MTLLRRLLAFVTDGAIVLLAMLVLLLLVWTGAMSWSAERDMLLFAATAAYFAGFEGTTGQTPGKRLWRIRLVEGSGRPPALHRALLRAVIFFFPPLVLPLVLELVGLLVYAPDELWGVITQGLMNTAVLVWPVSIVAGRGVAGIHDWMTGCYVERFGPARAAPIMLPRVLATGLLVSMALGFSGVGLVSAFLQRVHPRPPSARDMHEMEELLPPPVWFDEQIENAASWLVPPYVYYVYGVPRPSFSNSIYPALPATLREGTYEYRSSLGYDIHVRPGALTSSQFPIHLAQALVERTTRLLERYVPDGLVVRCRFVSVARVGFLTASVSKRLDGGWVKSPDGKLYWFLLEPDEAGEFTISLVPSWRDRNREAGMPEF